MKIKELILDTQDLEAQIEFYSTILGFDVLRRNKIKCSFILGQSLLTFRVYEMSKPYHFAFNINSNKEEEALAWLKQRLKLLKYNGEEMIDFKSWNAKALYFYDPDQNIVEFIARKNLNLNSESGFSTNSILNISEIGLATTNLKMSFDRLKEMHPIEFYSGDLYKFGAVGNEEGMFIMANPLKKKWFPINDDIQQSNFIIKGDFNFEFKNGEFIELN